MLADGKCYVLKTFFIGLGVLGMAIIAYLGFFGYFARDPFTLLKTSARPAPARAGLAAVFLSGDLGFDVALSKVVLKRLAADGVPVVGVNSLTFFRHHRSQTEVSAMITDAARRALVFGHAKRLILIGQSFGADMLQAGLTGLPSDLRAKVILIALIVPSKTLDYQVSAAEVFAQSGSDVDGVITGRQLNWAKAFCIFGQREKQSLCPLLVQPNMQKVALPGGHFLRHDGNALYNAIVSGLR